MAQQQQQQGGGDHSTAPIWLAIFVFFALFVVWKMARQYIVGFIFGLTLLQAKFISFFVNDPHLTQAVTMMQMADIKSVSWDTFVSMLEHIGVYTRYPVIILLFLLAIILYQSNITLKFRKKHSMKTLRAQEQYNWPAIMPIIKEDIVKEEIDKGPWAMALSPLEFAKKYDLLRKEDALLDQQTPGLELTAGVRRGDAKRVFTLQLGPYWEGFGNCPPHIIALAAVFVARINRDRDAATLILETIDKSFTRGKPDYSIAKPILKKYYNTQEVRDVIERHAYLLTVMASLIEAARLDGVVPSAEFLWLKPVDRRLWYMLNCVGRQTPFPEVAGVFAHWRAEKVMKRRSLVPMIDEAVVALEVAVKEIRLSERAIKELKS